MPQGGFARDYQRAAANKIKKAQADLEKERGKISEQVVDRVMPIIERRLAYEAGRTEEKLILKQDDIAKEFIKITHDRNRLLRFLLWTNFVSLLFLSFTLGYFL
jgi:hypothetical protein